MKSGKMSKTPRLSPRVLVYGDRGLLKPYLEPFRQQGFRICSDYPADMVLALECSDGELEHLRNTLPDRLIPIILINREGGTWPEGVDIVIRSPVSPQFVTAQLAALRNRISIERCASPLTGLPGASTAETMIQSRLDSGSPFCVTYIDINNFKPYNDAYGFEKGDRVIEALSIAILESLSANDAKGSFRGHIGGDDFLVLTSAVPLETMKRLTFEFDRIVRGFYTESDLLRGGIVSYDRDGKRKRFPLMSISVVTLQCGRGVDSREDISRRLAHLKRKAKQEAICTEGSVYLYSEGDEERNQFRSVLEYLIDDESIFSIYRRAAMEAAGELRMKEVVESLRHALMQSPDERVRKSAAYSLGRICDRVCMDELVGALNDPSPHVRMRAAEALGEMGDASALGPLLKTASDASKHARIAALTSIGQLGVSSAMPQIVHALTDFSIDVRVAAVKAVGAVGGSSAYPVLARSLVGAPPALTRAVAEAMGQVLDERCIDSLRQMLKSADQALVWRAAYSIYLLAKTGLIAVDKERITAPLIEALRSNNGYVLRASALALGAMGDPRAVPPLISLLKNPRESVRSAAAVSLGRLKDSRALGPLRLAMRDGRPVVRLKAAWALGELEEPDAVETLRVSLKDRVENVRETAALSICRLLEKSVLQSRSPGS